MHELGIVQTSETEESIDLGHRVDIEKVLDGTALTSCGRPQEFRNTSASSTSLLGEEEHRLVHGRRINVLGEVLVACAGTFGTYSTTCLLAEL